MALSLNSRAPSRGSRYRYASVTWAGDRQATVNADAAGDAGMQRLDVIVPNGMWLTPGARVALTHYPDGWVVVGLMVDHARRLVGEVPPAGGDR